MRGSEVIELTAYLTARAEAGPVVFRSRFASQPGNGVRYTTGILRAPSSVG
jgi:hypothetical protein